eukprot:CAMPEP_0176301338 /NCGR_PEP_ID=MMETSP0121_2-20121125/60801_1 /TAXON_ID=160619 /ORGANISM="Kryptoperidinium foliaceum, Strain CCMP 1326" /LENGTH=275 /DNA_ID=CAMNT_0017642785 /DNA_START=156 /DNA_END=984 /DNA_ORIENTATION=+
MCMRSTRNSTLVHRCYGLVPADRAANTAARRGIARRSKPNRTAMHSNFADAQTIRQRKSRASAGCDHSSRRWATSGGHSRRTRPLGLDAHIAVVPREAAHASAPSQLVATSDQLSRQAIALRRDEDQHLTALCRLAPHIQLHDVRVGRPDTLLQCRRHARGVDVKTTDLSAGQSSGLCNTLLDKLAKKASLCNSAWLKRVILVMRWGGNMKSGLAVKEENSKPASSDITSAYGRNPSKSFDNNTYTLLTGSPGRAHVGPAEARDELESPACRPQL